MLVITGQESRLSPLYSYFILDSSLVLITMDVNFRKIDIDQYDEDVLLDSELYDSDPRDPAQVLSDTKQSAAAVRSSLSKYVSERCRVAQRVLRAHYGQERLCRGSHAGAGECTIRPEC